MEKRLKSLTCSLMIQYINGSGRADPERDREEEREKGKGKKKTKTQTHLVHNT